MISTLADKTILTNLHTGGPNGTISRIVIHATVSPCVDGGAENNAHYFQTPGAGGSAHYVVDPAHVVCCVDENTVAYHAPPNQGSIGVELCDPQTDDRWGDPDHTAMLHLAAGLVADIAARHQLPLVWLSRDDLLAGQVGITSHANVSAAWHKTDHTDPGRFFPTAQFMALLTVSTPQPAPEDEMPGVQFQLPDGTIVVVPKTGEKPWAVPGAGAAAFHLLIDAGAVGQGALKVSDKDQAAALLALTK